MKYILKWDEENKKYSLRLASKEELQTIEEVRKLIKEAKKMYEFLKDEDIDDYYIAWTSLNRLLNEIDEISPIAINTNQYRIAW